MPNRILALDLQGSHLTAVVVESSFRSYRFVGHHSTRKDPARPLAEQLREFISRNGITADTVLSALPGDAASYRILDLPFRDRRKLQQTVPFEIESLVPFPLEEAIVDFQVLVRREDGARVFAALAPRRSIEEHLKMLSDAGLDPAVVDFAPLSTLNVLQLFEGDRPGQYAFLHLDQGLGTLALYRNGTLDGLRVLSVVGEPLDSGFLREIVWSLRSFDGGPPTDEAAGLPLLLGGQTPPGLLDRLKHELGFTVQRLEELPLRHVPDDFRAEQGAYASAIGLALREIADAPTLGLNFRRDDFAYHRAQQELRGMLSSLGVLTAVVLVLFFTATFVSYHRLSSHHAALQTAVRSVFTATLPDERMIVDEKMQLTQAIESLRKRTQQLGATPVSPLAVLREVSTRAPEEPRINVEELSFEAEALRLRAKTSSFESVEAVKRGLAESPLFREVQLKEPRTTPDGTVEFRLNILLGKDGSP
jgi:general secretion pathway protein L